MWHFNRVRGKVISPTGEEFTAYSGHHEGVNNPSLERQSNVGPIPAGVWNIQAPLDSPTHGPFAMHLMPDAHTQTYGRSGFMIHGDSKEHPGQASLGCVITARVIREKIWSDSDHKLQVV